MSFIIRKKENRVISNDVYSKPRHVCKQDCKSIKQAIRIIEDKTNGKFVAFTIASPCSVSAADVRTDEDDALYRLHVRPDRQGYGLGQWLEKRFHRRSV